MQFATLYVLVIFFFWMLLWEVLGQELYMRTFLSMQTLLRLDREQCSRSNSKVCKHHDSLPRKLNCS